MFSGMAQEGGIVRKGMQNEGLMRNSGGFLPPVFSGRLRNATSKEIFQKANESGFGSRIPEGITVAQKGGTWNLGFGGWAADRGAVQAGGRVAAGWLPIRFYGTRLAGTPAGAVVNSRDVSGLLYNIGKLFLCDGHINISAPFQGPFFGQGFKPANIAIGVFPEKKIIPFGGLEENRANRLLVLFHQHVFFIGCDPLRFVEIVAQAIIYSEAWWI